jgi:hypothetical protein
MVRLSVQFTEGVFFRFTRKFQNDVLNSTSPYVLIQRQCFCEVWVHRYVYPCHIVQWARIIRCCTLSWNSWKREAEAGNNEGILAKEEDKESN